MAGAGAGAPLAGLRVLVTRPGRQSGEMMRGLRALGAGGWLRHVVPSSHGGARETLDVRSICVIRETLAYHSGLADFAFAMQGLGSAPITLFGTPAQRDRWLPPVVRGESLAAFAISESEAGSDLAAMSSTARRDGDGWVVDGEKTWISNAGIAGHYVTVARFPEGGDRAYAAFVVPADAPGLSVPERIAVNAPHVLGTLRFEGCRLPADALLGEAGRGLAVALGTLDVFRSTVGAAALVRLDDETMALVGGSDGRSSVADLQLYDVGGDAWRAGPLRAWSRLERLPIRRAAVLDRDRDHLVLGTGGVDVRGLPDQQVRAHLGEVEGGEGQAHRQVGLDAHGHLDRPPGRRHQHPPRARRRT